MEALGLLYLLARSPTLNHSGKRKNDGKKHCTTIYIKIHVGGRAGVGQNADFGGRQKTHVKNRKTSVRSLHYSIFKTYKTLNIV